MQRFEFTVITMIKLIFLKRKSFTSALAFTAIIFAFCSGIALAKELLVNGSFEQPVTDGLSREFQVSQQGISGWTFADRNVQLLNHTRLLAGDGYQSLLLPCSVSNFPSLTQMFTVTNGGAAQISFKVAASKAVDGQLDTLLDGQLIKSIRFSDFWKPDELALTDQMKWRLMELPEMNLARGDHTLAFRVNSFQPRSDRQGDTRENVQGILLDAVSVQQPPFIPPVVSESASRWPREAPTHYSTEGVLPLDGVGGPWVETRSLACYFSIANFTGTLRSTKEMGAVQYLHFTDVGSADGVLNALSVDGAPVFNDQCRWYPCEIQTRSHVGPLACESATRMVFAGHGVLTQFTFTNNSGKTISRRIQMDLQAGSASRGANSNTLVLHGNVSRAYYFTLPPRDLIKSNGTTYAQWTLSLPPHSDAEIGLTLSLEKTFEEAITNATQLGTNFSTSFAAAKTDWENRWNAVFDIQNTTYSGCLPTLETDDAALRKIYYLSVASLLETERDNFPNFKQCFVGEDPEWGGDVTWFWDYSLTTLPYALLNPAVMKNELRHWLTIDWKTCSHFSLINGKPDGNWYAVNPYAYFISFDRYLTVTRDFGFLSEQVNGKTVLRYLEALADDWRRLVPKGGALADIGGNCWNMLEAPPNYIHGLASINAQSVWMMRRLAEYETVAGDVSKAPQLVSSANSLVPELLKLYNPATGSWNVLYPNGKQIDSRHIYDYLTIGTTISDDLSPTIKKGMIEFANRELMTETWMRAMSRQDPSAFNSDRSDHGPAGSYTGWPAKATEATAAMGDFPQALDMFHRFVKAFDSAIPQAIELTKVEGQPGLQARVSTRAGASFAEVSGSFADVVINTFFGFQPTPDGKTALWNPGQPRGFNGKLRHVRWGGNFYTIISDHTGLHLEKESN